MVPYNRHGTVTVKLIADAEDSNRRLLQRRESKKGDKQAQMSGNEDADPK
jgi:hypothetical protein